jgi:hypothetical protein
VVVRSRPDADSKSGLGLINSGLGSDVYNLRFHCL